MPRKQFDCNNCGGIHERPINSKCKMNNTLDKNNDQDLVLKDSNDTNALILNELKNLSSRMTAMESKVDGASYSPHRSHTSTRHTTAEDNSDDDDLVFPTVPALKQSKSMQQQVDERIRQLVKINEQGKFRSQRGGVENVWVKREVPWPQNYILGGSNKTRISYDSLSMSHWVSGFSQIIREEKIPKSKIVCSTICPI